MSKELIEVDFQHWVFSFPESLLIYYGSPHHDESTVTRDLAEEVQKHSTLQHSHAAGFDRDHILCANEAFPEAAIADPLADLDVWDEWRSGKRTFPYPGRYIPLRIVRQEAKTSSPSSVGVLGEIFTGLYAQAGIAPMILVRVVRKWPDFILHTRHKQYAFVESKAFTTPVDGRDGILARVPSKTLGECAAAAVQQINADPFVDVWGAFTQVHDINPLRIRVTFVQLAAPDVRRQAAGSRHIPAPVVTGMTELAVARAACSLEPNDRGALSTSKRGRKSRERRDAESRLHSRAVRQFEEIMNEAGVDDAFPASREAVESEVRNTVARLLLREGDTQSRFEAAKEKAFSGGTGDLRQVTGGSLRYSEMTSLEIAEFEGGWEQSWESAPEKFPRDGDLSLWRCGFALYALAGAE